MKKLNISKGKWEVLDTGVSIDINAEDSDGFTMVAELPKQYELTTANAILIAEAGTVANECGKTPRQLLEENQELLKALTETRRICNLDEWPEACTIIHNAITNATK